MEQDNKHIEEPIDEQPTNKVGAYFKKLGWAGIIFFTVKGTISTAIIIFGLKSCS